MHQRMWGTQIRFNGINNEGEKNEKRKHSWVDREAGIDLDRFWRVLNMIKAY